MGMPSKRKRLNKDATPTIHPHRCKKKNGDIRPLNRNQRLKNVNMILRKHNEDKENNEANDNLFIRETANQFAATHEQNACLQDEASGNTAKDVYLEIIHIPENLPIKKDARVKCTQTKPSTRTVSTQAANLKRKHKGIQAGIRSAQVGAQTEINLTENGCQCELLESPRDSLQEEKEEDDDFLINSDDDSFQDDSSDSDYTMSDCVDETDGSYSSETESARIALAALHYNANSERAVRRTKAGKEQVAVFFPKYKGGEPVLRVLREKPTYGYIQLLKQRAIEIAESRPMCELESQLREQAMEREPIPPTLSSQFVHPDKEEFLAQRRSRYH